MRRMVRTLMLVLALLPLASRPAAAQYREAAIGGGAGFLGGIAMTVSIVVARARLQGQYLDSAGDLIHWQTTPAIAGPAAGVFFGLAGEEVLVGSIIGSTGGMAIGAAAGAGLGWLLSSEQEWPWAGGVIGGGLGLALGGLTGAYLGWRKQEDTTGDRPPATLELRVPL